MTAEVTVASRGIILRVSVRREHGGALLGTPEGVYELSAAEAHALSGALITAASFEPLRPLLRRPETDDYFRIAEDGATA